MSQQLLDCHRTKWFLTKNHENQYRLQQTHQKFTKTLSTKRKDSFCYNLLLHTQYKKIIFISHNF